MHFDGTAIPSSSFAPIGSSGYGVARIEILASGQHTLESDTPFGAVAYGYVGSQAYLHAVGTGVEDLTAP